MVDLLLERAELNKNTVLSAAGQGRGGWDGWEHGGGAACRESEAGKRHDSCHREGEMDGNTVALVVG